MTPIEAHKLIEDATAHVTADRGTHIRIMEALRIVGTALMDAEAKKKIVADVSMAG